YDRDIPEVPLVVDRYDDALIFGDYRHEPDDDPWLADMVDAARVALDARETFVKRRERLVARRDGHQYERIDDAGAWRTVRERGLAFRVNLSDYLDTGL